MRLRWLVGVAVVALGAAGPMVRALPASAATALVAANFRLQETAYSPYVVPLGEILPNRSVSDVLDDANREGHPCPPTVNPAGVVRLVAAFCWQSGDESTTDWVPQGITTTADALPAGQYFGRRGFVVSRRFAGAGADKGVRLSFVDYADHAHPRYRHVLLVEPVAGAHGQPTFRPVTVHAGRIAVVRQLPLRRGHRHGLRAFEINRIRQVSTGNADIVGRQPNGTFHAFDYKYVIPQVYRYAASTLGGYPQVRHIAPGTTHRLVRFALNGSSTKLRTDTTGLATAVEAHDVGVAGMQGSTGIGGTFLLSVSDGSASNGDLVTFRPSTGAVTRFTNHLPIGREDVSYRNTMDAFWTPAEHAGQRAMVAVRASAYA